MRRKSAIWWHLLGDWNQERTRAGSFPYRVCRAERFLDKRRNVFTPRKGIVSCTDSGGWLVVFRVESLVWGLCESLRWSWEPALPQRSRPLIVESLQSSRLKKKLETTLPIGVHRCKTPFCKPGQARQNWLMRASYRLRPLVLVLVVIGWAVARDFSVNYNFFQNP